MSDLVWSLADTHCVGCGKPLATEETWNRDHDEYEHDNAGEGKCWCYGHCWESCDTLAADAEMLRLRALVEAQASVITRLRDGWIAGIRADGSHEWRQNGFYPPKWMPMTLAEQLVVYGEVVRTEEADTDGT